MRVQLSCMHNFTSSHTGRISTFEERSWRLRYTGPGVLNQEGTEIPNVERRLMLKKRWCEISFVAQQGNVPTECKASA